MKPTSTNVKIERVQCFMEVATHHGLHLVKIYQDLTNANASPALLGPNVIWTLTSAKAITVLGPVTRFTPSNALTTTLAINAHVKKVIM